MYATCSTPTPDHSDEQFSSGNPRKIATIRNQGFPHPLGRTQNRGFHIYLLRRRFHKRHSKQGCPHPFGEEVRTRIPNQGGFHTPCWEGDPNLGFPHFVGRNQSKVCHTACDGGLVNGTQSTGFTPTRQEACKGVNRGRSVEAFLAEFFHLPSRKSFAKQSRYPLATARCCCLFSG